MRFPLTLNYTDVPLFPVTIPNTTSVYWVKMQGPTEQLYIYCSSDDCSGAVIRNETSVAMYENATTGQGNDVNQMWTDEGFNLVYHMNEYDNDIVEAAGIGNFTDVPNVSYGGLVDGYLWGNGSLTGAGEQRCYEIDPTGLVTGDANRTTVGLYKATNAAEGMSLVMQGTNSDDTAFQCNVDPVDGRLELGFYGASIDFTVTNANITMDAWEVGAWRWDGSINYAYVCVMNETSSYCSSKAHGGAGDTATTINGYYDDSICTRGNGYIDELFVLDEFKTEAWLDEFTGRLYGNNVTVGSAEYGMIVILSPLDEVLYNETSVPLNWTNRTDYISVYYSLNGGNNITVTGNTTIEAEASGDYNLTLYMEGADSNLYSDSVSFSLNDLLVNCSTPGAVEAVNFTFLDELTKEMMNGSAEYAIVLAGGNFESNYSGAVDDVTYFTVCTMGGPWYVDMILRYEGDGYATRFYLFDNASIGGGDQEEINLFMLNETMGTDITVTVQNPYGYELADVYVKFQKYYIAEDIYRTVAMIKTDDVGEGVVFLDYLNEWYKFTLTQNGVVLRIIGPSVITSSELTLSTSSGIGLSWEDYSDGIGRTCSYNPTSKYLVCTIDDATGLANEVCLKVEEANVINLSLYDEDCESSTSMTLMVNLTDAESYNDTIVYTLYADTTDGDVVLERDTLQFGAGNIYGTLGVFLTIMIFVTAVGAGAYNPAISIVMGGLGIIVSSILVFINIPLVGLGSIIVVLGIYALAVKT